MSDKIQFVDLVAEASACFIYAIVLKSVPGFVERVEKNYVR